MGLGQEHSALLNGLTSLSLEKGYHKTRFVIKVSLTLLPLRFYQFCLPTFCYGVTQLSIPCHMAVACLWDS